MSDIIKSMTLDGKLFKVTGAGEGTKTITSNGLYNVSEFEKVDVSMPTGPVKSSSDVTVSGATVTIPAGVYSSGVTKAVKTTTHPEPSVTINTSTGVVTASHNQNVGYVVTGGVTDKTLELPVYSGESESGIITDSSVRYKEWTVTLPSKVSSGTLVLVTDEIVAAHRNDETAQAFVKCEGELELDNFEYHEFVSLLCTNIYIGHYSNLDLYGIGTYRSSSSWGLNYSTLPFSGGNAPIHANDSEQVL